MTQSYKAWALGAMLVIGVVAKASQHKNECSEALKKLQHLLPALANGFEKQQTRIVAKDHLHLTNIGNLLECYFSFFEITLPTGSQEVFVLRHYIQRNKQSVHALSNTKNQMTTLTPQEFVELSEFISRHQPTPNKRGNKTENCLKQLSS